MHATHQFFLTRRSLYIVVLDARKGEEDSRLFYWLRIIRSYGGDSPVLVLTNKSETTHLDLNEYRLRKDYPNVRGFFRVSCKANTGLANLKTAIIQEIQDLEHVYSHVPVSFLATKRELEDHTKFKDYLEIEEYRSICEEHKIDKASDQELLLRFLHDLGSVLHFADPDSPYRLEETKILNPEWVTRGVYKILNHRPLAKNGGVLKLRDLDCILTRQDGYSRKSCLFILGMMHKFELCFLFPGHSHRYLVPELLPRNEPELGLNHEDALRFEYHYDFLTEGVLPRLIVRLHAHLTPEPVYWRSGVLLKIDTNRTLVRGDTQEGRIYIDIFDAPAGRRRSLAVVRSAFKAIHATIPGLVGEEMLSFPRDPGVKPISYEHLILLEASGETSFWPVGARKKYSVQKLLDGFESPEARQQEYRDLMAKFDDLQSEIRHQVEKDETPEEEAITDLAGSIPILGPLLKPFVRRVVTSKRVRSIMHRKVFGK